MNTFFSLWIAVLLAWTYLMLARGYDNISKDEREVKMCLNLAFIVSFIGYCCYKVFE